MKEDTVVAFRQPDETIADVLADAQRRIAQLAGMPVDHIRISLQMSAQ